MSSTSNDRTHYRISPAMWHRKRKHWTDDMRLLAFYLLTSPHRNTEGLYLCPIGYVAADLGWVSDRVSDTLSKLSGEGFAEYDPDAEVVFLARALAWQAPGGPKQIKGALNSLRDLPDTPLFSRHYEAAKQYAIGYAEGLAQRYPKRIGIPPSPSPSPSPDPKEVPEEIEGEVADGDDAGPAPTATPVPPEARAQQAASAKMLSLERKNGREFAPDAEPSPQQSTPPTREELPPHYPQVLKHWRRMAKVAVPSAVHEQDLLESARAADWETCKAAIEKACRTANPNTRYVRKVCVEGLWADGAPTATASVPGVSRAPKPCRGGADLETHYPQVLCCVLEDGHAGDHRLCSTPHEYGKCPERANSSSEAPEPAFGRQVTP